MRPRSAGPGTPPSDDIRTGDLSGRCIGSSYQLIEPIGGGATGAVWRALDRITGEHVAVKLLREELMTQPKAVIRFVQERAILLMLHHDNIVRVRDLLAIGDSLGLVMDLVPGGSLREHLRRHGTLPACAAAAILAQISDALTEAHSLGVVHRDLKPDNILLDQVLDDPTANPRVRLTDFGIARVLDAAGLTTPEALIGTPNYLAPEIINGARPTPAVDVYAMGVLLYELVTGRPPYAGGPPVTVLRRHLECTPHRYPGIPEAVWQVIIACTDKDPSSRPSSNALVTTMRTLAGRTCGVPALAPQAPPPFAVTSAPSQRRPASTRSAGSAIDSSATPPAASSAGSPPAPPAPRRPRWRGNQRLNRRMGGLLTRFPSRRCLLGVGAAAFMALVAGIAVGAPGWNLLDRDRDRDRPSAAAPPATGPGRSTTPPATPSATPQATATIRPARGAPEVRRPLPVSVPAVPAVPPVRIRARVYGALQCPDAYTWDTGHPVRAKPCHAIGPAIRLLGRTQALPGVQADITLTLEEAGSGVQAAGPFTCRGLVFTEAVLERSCGPFETTARQGRRYVVVQKWAYTGHSVLPGGSARSEPFTW